jgi:hypothetical protein
MKEIRYERLHAMQRMEAELVQLWNVYGTDCSDHCLKVMKHIYKTLRDEIFACEMAKVDAQLQKGIITKMQARKARAAVKRRFRK